MKIIRKICSLLVAVSTAFAGIGSAIYCPSLLTEASYLDYTSNEINDVPVVVSETWNDDSETVYSSTKEKVLAFADSRIGDDGTEVWNYWNKYGFAWCAAGITYAFKMCGVPDSNFPNSTFVEAYRVFYNNKNKFVYRSNVNAPSRGWLVIMDYENDGEGNHIEIIKYVDYVNRRFSTIGFNSNDRVEENHYSFSDTRIMGYCMVDYGDETNTQPPVTTSISTTTTTTTTTTTSVQTFTTTAVTIAEITSEVTSAVIPETAAPVTTTAPSYTVPDTFRFNRYYISSLIGANLRSECRFGDNILRVLDTDDRVIVKYYINDFAFVEVEKTGEIGFVHMSVISIEGEKRYTNGCLQSHYVSSDIGCNLRQYGSFDAPVIAILDTYTSLTVLSRDESTGFNYVEVNLDDGTALNGYVHSSVICSLK